MFEFKKLDGGNEIKTKLQPRTSTVFLPHLEREMPSPTDPLRGNCEVPRAPSSRHRGSRTPVSRLDRHSPGEAHRGALQLHR